MNFLQPQFLYGLFALSIPIIVHLFNFRKAKKVYFPNTVFLEQVKQSSSAKRKLKHYLILLARLLTILFLVLAFAQPFIPAGENGLQKNHVVIYIDNSQSMSNLTPDEIRGLDEAVSYANQLLELYPRETQYLLLTNDFESFSNRFYNADKVSDKLTELRLSNMTRTSSEVNQRIQSITRANNVQDYDLFLISDFQKSTLPEVQELRIDSLINTHLLPVDFTEITNLSIGSVYQDNPFSITQNKTKVTALVKNTGSQPIKEATLKLFLNDQQSSSKTVDLDGNTQTEVDFDVVYNLNQSTQAYFVIDDYPIAFDNQFYFMLEKQKPLRIIEIKGDVETNAIKSVYGNQELFEYALMPEGNINYNSLNEADLIVLHSLSSLPSSLSNQLLNYQQSGGGIAIIPSIEFDPTEYQSLLNSSINLIEQGDDTPLISLQKPDLNDPFYEDIFEQNNVSFSMPSAKPLLNWNRMHDLLKTSSGDSYLSMSDRSGLTFLFASPLISDFTDITQQALFVPIMYKIASYRSSKVSKLYYDMNAANITIELDSISTDQLYSLSQNDKELIPSQLIRGRSLIIEIPRGELDAGFVQLQIEDQNIMDFAINSDRKESNPEQWTTEELGQLASANENVRLFANINSDNFTQEMKETYEGTPLWKYAIVLTLLFIFVEIFIIRFYNPTRK